MRSRCCRVYLPPPYYDGQKNGEPSILHEQESFSANRMRIDSLLYCPVLCVVQ